MIGVAELARRDQRELVLQIARVLDDPHDAQCAGALVPDSADAQPVDRRDTAGHRDLPGGWVVAGVQPQHRGRIEPVRLLRANVDGVDRAGDRRGRVLDHLDPAEPRPGRRDIGRLLGRRAGDVQQVVGGAELGTRRRRPGRGERDAGDGGNHRDDQQADDCQLLAPFAPE